MYSGVCLIRQEITYCRLLQSSTACHYAQICPEPLSHISYQFGVKRAEKGQIQIFFFISELKTEKQVLGSTKNPSKFHFFPKF